jgi:hypothetical protein
LAKGFTLGKCSKAAFEFADVLAFFLGRVRTRFLTDASVWIGEGTAYHVFVFIASNARMPGVSLRLLVVDPRPLKVFRKLGALPSVGLVRRKGVRRKI